MKRFPSVRKNSEFQRIYRSGTSYVNRLLVMYAAESGEDRNQVGVPVSKKVGSDAVRHHITRPIREIFRLNDHRLKTGLNITVVARAATKTSEYKDLKGAYMHLCKLHHILREPR